MNIKERILEMPVWKAVIGLFIIVIFSVFMIEDFFVNLIFNKINNTISYFQMVDQEDRNDLKRDFLVSKDKSAVISAMNTYKSEKKKIDNTGTDLDKYCFAYQNIDRLNQISHMKGYQNSVDEPININLELITLNRTLDFSDSSMNSHKCEAVKK